MKHLVLLFVGLGMQPLVAQTDPAKPPVVEAKPEPTKQSDPGNQPAQSEPATPQDQPAKPSMPLPPATTTDASGIALYKALVANPKALGKDLNFVLSPICLRETLQALELCARGKSATELAKVLRPGKTPAKPENAGSPLNTTADGDVLTQARGIWVSEKWPIKPECQSALESLLGTTVQPAAFATDPGVQRDKMNAWIKEKTKDRVPELLKTGDVEGATRLVLATALAFDGQWDKGFSADLTKPHPFANATGQKLAVPTMEQTAEFDYHSLEDGTQLVSLSASKKRFQALFILPSAPGKKVTALQSLQKLEQKLTTDNVAAWAGLPKPKRLRLLLPKFSLNTGADLRPPMKNLGAASLFNPVTANLTGLSDEPALCVTVLKHQATVEIDEHGARGSAATAAAITSRSFNAENPLVVHFNRPFLFLIRDTATGHLLFLGRVGNLKPGTGEPIPAVQKEENRERPDSPDPAKGGEPKNAAQTPKPSSAEAQGSGR